MCRHPAGLSPAVRCLFCNKVSENSTSLDLEHMWQKKFKVHMSRIIANLIFQPFTVEHNILLLVWTRKAAASCLGSTNQLCLIDVMVGRKHEIKAMDSFQIQIGSGHDSLSSITYLWCYSIRISGLSTCNFSKRCNMATQLLTLGTKWKTTKAKLPMIDFTLMLDSSPEFGDYTSLTWGNSMLSWTIFP